MAQPEVVIGVDLGGTNVRAQAVRRDGSPAGKKVKGASHADQGVQATISSLVRTIEAARAACEFPAAGIGLSIPGHVDDATGHVLWSPNFGEWTEGYLRSWRDVDVRTPLESRLGLPVVMGNDANLAAMGEYQFGVGKGSAKCLVMLTLGTGVGGGVVLSPEAVMGNATGPLLLLGGNKGGAELGHMVIRQGGLDCSAGSYGAIEAYCQRDSIAKRALHRLQKYEDSLLRELTAGAPLEDIPRLISVAARRKDWLARDIWREVGEALGAGIGSMINIFAPDIFAIGGNVRLAGKWLFEPAISEARNIAIPSLFRDVKIVPAETGDRAGMLGAAAIAFLSPRIAGQD